MAESRVIIVTGMSGAGRSTTANVLEDAGYFVVDNLPPTLMVDVVDQVGLAEGTRGKVALVADTRVGITASDLDDTLLGLLGRGIRTTVLFLDADDQTLIDRFEETRRMHPVREGSLADKIATERARFEEIRGKADIIVDTTNLNVHELRKRLEEAFVASLPDRRMRVDVTSFGFKRGVPRVVDLMFDVRFLPNPHWVPELRELTGLDDEVREYVLTRASAEEFMERIRGLLEFLIPHYEDEGKAYLTIGVGCTGGKHRSVAIAEEIGAALTGTDIDVVVRHRDVEDGSQ
ncbi:MAG: RNase adapter RapZ [Acidimicrobiia bacterium]